MRIDVEFVANLPLIEVEIAKKKYRFLVDTGAFSVLSDTLVDELKLPLKEKLDVVCSFGKMQQHECYVLNSLNIDTEEFENIEVLRSDMMHTFPTSCIGFDGILGYNFLERFVMLLEYKKQKLTLMKKTPFMTGYKKIALHYDGTKPPQIPLAFDFGDIFFGIDTGKSDGVLVGSRVEIPKECIKRRGVFRSSLHGIDETQQIKRFLLRGFSIDRAIEIDSFMVDHDGGQHYLLGNSFLQHFDMMIDFAKSYLYLKQHTPIVSSLKRDFGLFLLWSEQKGLYISALDEPSFASQKGLEVGDRILSINGVDMFEFSQDDFCKMMESTSLLQGERAEIVVQRDAKIMRKVLQL